MLKTKCYCGWMLIDVVDAKQKDFVNFVKHLSSVIVKEAIAKLVSRE